MPPKRRYPPVLANPRGEHTRICLTCARWGASEPTNDCSHPRVLEVEASRAKDLGAVSGLAEAAARAREHLLTALGALDLAAERLRREGHARIETPPLGGRGPSNVVPLRAEPERPQPLPRRRGTRDGRAS